jgi:hypothetical protein
MEAGVRAADRRHARSEPQGRAAYLGRIPSMETKAPTGSMPDK